MEIYSPVNAPGKAAPGLVTAPGRGRARRINTPFIPEASALIGANPRGRFRCGAEQSCCRGTHLADAATMPAPTTPRGVDVTGCHQGASPWGSRDVPGGRTSHGSGFLHLPPLAATSGFQALVLHFCSPAAPRASDSDARPARCWADAHHWQESTQVPSPGISYMVHGGLLPFD